MNKRTAGRRSKAPKPSSTVVALGKPTITVPKENLKDMVSLVDLTGLVYPKAPNPVIFVGVPKPYVDEFKRMFVPNGVKPNVSKKEGGNKYYIRISRALDLYKICLALDGKTLVHQKAVKAIREKLEERYGKAALQAAAGI